LPVSGGADGSNGAGARAGGGVGLGVGARIGEETEDLLFPNLLEVPTTRTIFFTGTRWGGGVGIGKVKSRAFCSQS